MEHNLDQLDWQMANEPNEDEQAEIEIENELQYREDYMGNDTMSEADQAMYERWIEREAARDEARAEMEEDF